MGKQRNRRKQQWDEGGHWQGFAACQYTPEPSSFPRFWFEGNQAWGEIKTEPELRTLVCRYAEAHKETIGNTVGLLANARRNPGSSRDLPEFGLYAEHNGEESLADFLNKNGVTFTVRLVMEY